MWKDNKWVGEYRYYHENGNLFYNWVYNSQGKREGNQQYFYDNGNLMIEGNWKEGAETGLLKEYYENGSVKSEKQFATGKIEPEATVNYELSKKFDDNATKAKKLAESIRLQYQTKQTSSNS